MSARAAAAARIAAVEAELLRARAALDAGEPVVLDRLERLVDMTCAAATGLAGEDKAALRPAMLALVSELDGLHGAMRAVQARLGSELGFAGARRQAMAAYGRRSGG